LGLWVVFVPLAGALIIGLMACFGSEKIRGHGIPEALEAILLGRSRIELKVALLKPLSAAISIGTCGPFGAEGPIIMTGGAFGSLFAQQFHLSGAERNDPRHAVRLRAKQSKSRTIHEEDWRKRFHHQHRAILVFFS
jgi:CIC family chloride channel protein